LGKKPSASAGSLTSDIPKSISEMFTVGSNRIVIVDFYADWCGPCRMLSPILETIASENPNTVLLCKVNIDKFSQIASQEGVKSIPDIRIFQDGKLVEKFIGALPEAEVRKRIETLVKQLPPPPEKDGNGAKSKSKEAAIQPMSKDWMPPGVQRR
jgi:thioredoxin